MRILLTGGTGFIGRSLIRALLAQHEVICVGRQARPDGEWDGVRWIQADLNAWQPDEVFPPRVNAVIHLAQANVAFPEGADELFRVNVDSTHRLAAYARRAGASRFIYASSGSVYAPGAGPLTETGPRAPHGFYGVTKRCSELLLEAFKPFFDVSILRLFVPYGPGQHGRMIPNIVQAVRDGRPVVLVNDGRPRMNPVFIDDVVEVMSQALSKPGSQVVNVAGPREVNVRDIATMAGEVLGRPPVFEERSQPECWDLLGDTTAFRRLFALNKWTAPEEGIRRLVEAVGSGTGSLDHVGRHRMAAARGSAAGSGR